MKLTLIDQGDSRYILCDTFFGNDIQLLPICRAKQAKQAKIVELLLHRKHIYDVTVQCLVDGVQVEIAYEDLVKAVQQYKETGSDCIPFSYSFQSKYDAKTVAAFAKVLVKYGVSKKSRKAA